MRSGALALGLTIFGFASPALAADATLIVHRMSTGVEMFVSAPAPVLFDLFQADSTSVPDRDGYVDFDAFRYGTWGIGDGLLAGSEVTLGTQPAVFEGMSFMLHPSTDPMPFDTVVDALVAISVCSVIPEEARFGLEELDAYVGFYAHRQDSLGDLVLRLPAVAEPVTLRVRDYGMDGRFAEYDVTLLPDADPVIQLGAPPLPQGLSLVPVLAVLGGLAAASLTALALVVARRRKVSLQV